MTPEYVHYYVDHVLPFLQRMRTYYEQLHEWNLVIEQAALGQHPNQNGILVMDGHQRRIGYSNCRTGAYRLRGELPALMDAVDFENLFTITEGVRSSRDTYRLGLLWSYDTALRIGFWKDRENPIKEFEPEQVYLQCGTRNGARDWLNLTRISDRLLPSQVFVDALPDTGIEHMESYVIENLLCVGHHDGWQVPD